MPNEEMMRHLLAPYGPQRPIDQLVVEVNRVYHSFEAPDYDKIHPEITKQLPPIWREMIRIAAEQEPQGGWHILDYGCGTGFEAEQLVRGLPPGSVRSLLCYDPSAEMLQQCEKRIRPLFPEAILTADPATLYADSGAAFNLLATNSLLHHLPEPLSVIRDLSSVLAEHTTWLAGHEPSARYYRNPECSTVYEEYTRRRDITKYLSARNYLFRAEALLGKAADPVMQTARAAHKEGLFAEVPSRTAIARLVDYHVAHSREEAREGRGLDIEEMKRDLAGEWTLVWARSYAFMGPYYEGKLPARWAKAAARLRADFPMDGANFSSVWVRET